MRDAALESFTITQSAADMRADGGRRVIHVSASRIVIERTLHAVRMTVAVPVSGYASLVLSVRPQSATASLRLRHEDPDLDVALGTGDAIETARLAKAWGALFQKEIVIEEAAVTMRSPFARLRKRAKKGRRSTFARRRQPGDRTRLGMSFAGECEIIART